MANYTRMTVHGVVVGRHAGLVNAAAEVLDSMVPAGVADLASARRTRTSRVGDLVAALTLDYDVRPAQAG